MKRSHSGKHIETVFVSLCVYMSAKNGWKCSKSGLKCHFWSRIYTTHRDYMIIIILHINENVSLRRTHWNSFFPSECEDECKKWLKVAGKVTENAIFGPWIYYTHNDCMKIVMWHIHEKVSLWQTHWNSFCPAEFHINGINGWKWPESDW